MNFEPVYIIYCGSKVIRDASMELSRTAGWEDHRITNVPRWKCRLTGFDLATLGYETIIFVFRMESRSVAKFKKTNVEPGVVFAESCEEFAEVVPDEEFPGPFDHLVEADAK